MFSFNTSSAYFCWMQFNFSVRLELLNGWLKADGYPTKPLHLVWSNVSPKSSDLKVFKAVSIWTLFISVRRLLCVRQCARCKWLALRSRSKRSFFCMPKILWRAVPRISTFTLLILLTTHALWHHSGSRYTTLMDASWNAQSPCFLCR